MPASTWICFQSRISGPWSQVSERRRRPVATVAVGVAAQLARDRRRRPLQSAGDRTDRLAACTGQRDLLTLPERQATAPEVAPAARPHAAARGHPARALLAIGTHCHGGVSDELAALQRRPERLHHLRYLSVDEPRHPLPPRSRTAEERARCRATAPGDPHARRSPLRLALRARLRADRRAPHQAARTTPLSELPTASCCDHRENPRIPLWYGNGLCGRDRPGPELASPASPSGPRLAAPGGQHASVADAARGARRAPPPGVGTAVLKRSSSSGTDGRNVRPRRAVPGIASACLGSEGLGVGGGQALARGRVAARRQ